MYMHTNPACCSNTVATDETGNITWVCTNSCTAPVTSVTKSCITDTPFAGELLETVCSRSGLSTIQVNCDV